MSTFVTLKTLLAQLTYHLPCLYLLELAHFRNSIQLKTTPPRPISTVGHSGMEVLSSITLFHSLFLRILSGNQKHNILCMSAECRRDHKPSEAKRQMTMRMILIVMLVMM